MGEYEGWAAQQPPIGLLPNGLLPNEAASVIRVLDSERWMKAEERTADLIACIQPDSPSESRRNAVADYVQRLIARCFPCQVFTFGSVPLKTYLPDGDIDLTAFSKNQILKDTWAHQVRDMLENEEKNENAEFRVKEVQYIQAEVKIIKCLVENIVVDISFNQLGGLCTLCFLEEVDLLINQNHLFKRSIILIKAWCYYESRILGAHHGLISTYALETLVLYIFHVYNKSFSGPLEVLYRFLEFFSKFDWENFCVSLWGPVPIRSLPDISAEPPRKDGGELLLSKYFLDTCSSRYAVCQENQGQPFTSKHFNVIDPLRLNNNLGRSVSKGNFFRIRSAFAFGAKKLARLLDCPKEDLEGHLDDNRGNDVFFDERTTSSRSMTASHTSSLRSKTSSESSWEGSSAKVCKPAWEKRGRKLSSSAVPSATCGKGKSISDYSSQAEDNSRDWNPPSIVSSDMAERTIEPQPVCSLPVPRHQISGFETALTSGSDPLIPITPFLLGPGSGQRTMDNSGVPPLAFTITGPPVPFVLCPVYNIPAETGAPDASTSHFGWDEGLDNNDSCQNFESSEGLDQSEVLSTSSSMRNASSLEPVERKSDILNGDIASHWQNLQYGRFCQNSQYPPPLIYPSPVVVPPVYLQGHFPWDGPGRPPPSNVNLFSQLMNYGPRIISAPHQSVSNRPASVYQQHADEMPRYCSGTGTYMPNPKVSIRERHSANTRRGKYNYDRNDHHGDRDGNWIANSKSQAAGYSHSCNQNEKSRFTCDQLGAVADDSRAERPWGSHRHDSFSSYQSHNGPVCANSSQGSSASMQYDMYPLPAMKTSGASSNGPTIPSVVMLYPYDHNSGYGSSDEQLEFGSLGPVDFSGMNEEASQASDGSNPGGVYDKQRFHGTSAQQSSPDQPSSPHLQRGL
uniref:Polymerase nucleotidyl transferase domain-containing protein n=1 Tax=Gossypium raimondii TaxID=29730 RepID=A0A0D2LZ56_GOSRA|nr:hypothetical protein B456_001G155400 [Gossypium raimondii]